MHYLDSEILTFLPDYVFQKDYYVIANVNTIHNWDGDFFIPGRESKG